MQDGDHEGGGGHHTGGSGEVHHPTQPAQPQHPTSSQPSQPDTTGPNPDKKWDEHTTQHVPIHDHEKDKDWWDLPEDRRKELAVRKAFIIIYNCAHVADLGCRLAEALSRDWVSLLEATRRTSTTRYIGRTLISYLPIH